MHQSSEQTNQVRGSVDDRTRNYLFTRSYDDQGLKPDALYLAGYYVRESLDDVKITIDPKAFQCFCDHYDACYSYYDTLFMCQVSAQVK